MAVNDIGKYILPMPESWDDARVNTEKHNWQVVRDVLNREVGKYISPEIMQQILSDVRLKYKEEVATVAELPTSDEENTIRAVTEEGKLYIFDGLSWKRFQTIDMNKINEVESRLKEGFESKINDIAVNVRDFGAVGNGTTDDTAAILEARDYVLQNGGVLLIPESFTCKAYGVVDLSGLRYVEIKGRIDFDDPQNDELILKYNASFGLHAYYTVNRITNGTLKIIGVKNGVFNIRHATRVLLYADGANSSEGSLAYSSFNLGRIDLLEFNSINGGWINENKFFGGRVIKVLMDGDYNHNHNIFYGPTLESTGENAEVTINSGNSNIFHDVRWEGDNNLVTFGEGTWDNVVIRSWQNAPDGYMQGSYGITAIDRGKNNRVVNMLDAFTTFKRIFELHKFSNNYNLNYVNGSEENLQIIFDGVYKRLFETEKTEILTDFSLTMDSDTSMWRMFAEIYDPDGVQITDSDTINKCLTSATKSISSSGVLRDTTNRSRSHLSVNKTDGVKYIKVYINAQSQSSFGFMNVLMRTPSNVSYDFKYPSRLQRLTCNNNSPNTDLPVGTIAYYEDPVSHVGIVKTANGWQNFGAI